MRIIEQQDKYNPDKVWVIKKTPCRHYYLNQKIKGRYFYQKFKRVSKSFLNDLDILPN